MTKEQAVKKAKRDCIFFGERYFPHLLTSKTGAFHRELIAIVETSGKDRVDILAPRGHAKSTWLSIIYPIWKIANNRNIHILIVSDIAEQAEMFVQAIKNELEFNELLIGEFGEFRPKEKIRDINGMEVEQHHGDPREQGERTDGVQRRHRQKDTGAAVGFDHRGRPAQ